MKVGFLTERMLMGYGVDLVINELAKRMVERGIDTTVFCAFHDEMYINARYRIVRLPVEPCLDPGEYERRATVASRDQPDLQDVDVLIVESFPFYAAASSLEVPWIAVDHGVPPTWGVPRRAEDMFRYIKETQYSSWFNKSERIVCVSRYLLNELPTNLKSKATVIYSGIDHYMKRFNIDLRGLFNIEGPLLLYLGRSVDTSPYKNTNELLEIYNSLKEQRQDAAFLMACACSEREKERLERRGAIVVSNALPEFIPSIYCGSDIYVTASRWEGFDLPLMEASYFGRPCVAYNVGGHPEVVKDGLTGFLVDSKDEFKKRLSELITDPKRREDMGLKAKEHASNFTWERATENYVTLLEETCKSA